MDRKYFVTLLVGVFSVMFFTLYILHLKSQIRISKIYLENHKVGKFDGDDDNHSLYYTYLSPTRDEWQFPEEVIRRMDIRQGDVIADIGAGSGYFTFKFAKAVGSSGKVYGLEVSDLAINIMQEIVSHSRIKGVNFDNVVIMKTKEDSICLNENMLDFAFMCELHFYRDMSIDENSRRMIDSIYKALKKGGRLIIIEKYEMRDNITNLGIIRKNFEANGFIFVESYDFLPLQLFIIFER